jgi:hypothetical protein
MEVVCFPFLGENVVSLKHVFYVTNESTSLDIDNSICDKKGRKRKCETFFYKLNSSDFYDAILEPETPHLTTLQARNFLIFMFK